MKAAVLHSPNTPLRVEEVSLDPPRSGEVLLRVAASGVCRSDHHLITGATPHPMPVVCGHEASGVIQKTGEGVTRVKPGDPVVLSWAPACGACFYCGRGLPAQCEAYLPQIWQGTLWDGSTRLSLDGARVHHYSALSTFAEQAVVPESCCVPIPPDVPLGAAALIGCAVATGVGAVLNRARVEQGSSVAVFGCGGVGTSILQGAALAGASRIIAVDPSPRRRKSAGAFGATETLDPAEADPVPAIRGLTQGRGADYCFEAIGAARVMQQAIEATRRGGMAILVGLGPSSETLSLGAGSFTRSDRIVAGAYYGLCDPARDMPRLIELYREGKLKLEELVERRRPLEEINEAFDDMLSGEVLRTLIAFDT